MGLSGRRIGTIVALALALATALAVPLAAQAQGGASESATGGRPPKARVITDGLLTVGAQETLRVVHVPRRPHRRVRAFIYPPSTATICNHESFDLELFSLCLPQPLHPVPGTPPLKINKKNRGSLTFVMPAAYEYIDPYDPTQSHPITLVDGQTVYLYLEIIWKPAPRSIEGGTLAYKPVRVQVPPS